MIRPSAQGRTRRGVGPRRQFLCGCCDEDRARLHVLYVREGVDVRSLDPADIRAIRLPPGSAAPTVSRGSWLDTDSRPCRMTVTLDGIQPPIWRRLDVPARVTMAKLHQFLQAALGWTDSHLHAFEIGDERIAVPYHADQLAEGQITRGGDGGARCLDGARACPPEDCGGADGYARFLEILFDPRHPEFEEMRA